jgi:hypothetical protein
MTFKALYCLLLSRNGKPCNRYLGDVEAGADVTLRFTCCGKHEGNINRIEFSQDKYGRIYYAPIDGKTEKKIYNDDNVRIQHV